MGKTSLYGSRNEELTLTKVQYNDDPMYYTLEIHSYRQSLCVNGNLLFGSLNELQGE